MFPLSELANAIELMIVRVFSMEFTFFIGVFYRLPNFPVSIDILYHVLQSLNPSVFCKFVLVGDFNIDMLSSSAPLSSHLSVILNSFCMSQVVNSPTHIAPNGRESLIDLALISDPASFQYCHVFPPTSNSDHRVVSCHFTHQLVSFCKRNRRTVWIYSKADFTRASELITDTNWPGMPLLVTALTLLGQTGS